MVHVTTDKYAAQFVVDDADDALVYQRRWNLNCDNGYPSASFGGRRVLLHIMLMGPAPQGLEWDHRDRDKLNNRRGNLRLVTRRINTRNAGPQHNSTTGIIGVRRYNETRWEAYIYVKRVQKSLGLHDTIEKAATARREAEDQLWNVER